MRYVAAYLLATLGGNSSPSSKDLKSILGSVGIEADDERLKKVKYLLVACHIIISTLSLHRCLMLFSQQVISELNGKDINEVMNSGKCFQTCIAVEFEVTHLS